MLLTLANTIVTAGELYAVAGLIFAAAFLPRGVLQLDERLHGAPITVRLLILPGVAALWPLFAWRWITGAREPVERNAHRTAHRKADRSALRSGAGRS
jgi:hypothetical protein